MFPFVFYFISIHSLVFDSWANMEVFTEEMPKPNFQVYFIKAAIFNII